MSLSQEKCAGKNPGKLESGANCSVVDAGNRQIFSDGSAVRKDRRFVAAACDDVMHCNIDAANVSVDNPLIKKAHQASSS
eukprot:scaffold8672_cov135-Skeletonema_marinoi.AAC.3